MPDRTGLSIEALPLGGCHVLLVEDEYLIADDIAALLREAGAELIGPASSLPEAMRLAKGAERIDLAVLDIYLDGVTVFPLADYLMTRGVRMMFLTGYDDDNIPEQFAPLPRCGKPTGPACVLEELQGLLRPMAA